VRKQRRLISCEPTGKNKRFQKTTRATRKKSGRSRPKTSYFKKAKENRLGLWMAKVNYHLIFV